MTDLEILGAAETTFEDAVDTAAEPVRRPRATAGRRRRGAEAPDEVAAPAGENGATAVVLPERLLHDALRLVKREAKRDDVLGIGARVLLQGINVPAANAAGFFARLERETEVALPARRSATAAKRTTAGRKRGGRKPRRAA